MLLDFKRSKALLPCYSREYQLPLNLLRLTSPVRLASPDGNLLKCDATRFVEEPMHT